MRKAKTGRVVNVGGLREIGRRAGQVLRSPQVQQQARELLPATRRLLRSVRREWSR